MNEKNPEELQEQLAGKTRQLRGLKSSRRKARAVNIIGTICGFALVGFFVYLFLSPILELKAKAESGEITDLLQERMEEERLVEDVQRYANMAQEELRPVYQEKMMKMLDEMKIREKAQSEAQTLARQAWEMFKPKLESRLKEIDPQALAEENMDEIWAQVWPTYRELLQKKDRQYGISDTARTEAQGLVEEVAPVYWKAISEKIDETQIVPEIRTAAQDVVEEVRPTYMAELDRIKPEIRNAAEDEVDVLVEDVQVLLRDKMRGALKKSLERQERRLQADLNLSDSEMDNLMVNVAEANRKALRSLFEERTREHKVLVDEIELELEKIPLADEYNLDAIQQELFRVSVTLLKYNLPDYYESKEIQID